MFGRMLKRIKQHFTYPKYRIVKFEFQYGVQIKEGKRYNWRYLDRRDPEQSYEDYNNDLVNKYCLHKTLEEAEAFVDGVRFEVVKYVNIER